MINHYKKAVDNLACNVEESEQSKLGNIPYITGPFTNWNYKSMREVIPFCKIHDNSPPRFLEMAIEQGEVRHECSPGPGVRPLNEEEKETIKKMTDDYYQKNWSKIILRIMRY